MRLDYQMLLKSSPPTLLIVSALNHNYDQRDVDSTTAGIRIHNLKYAFWREPNNWALQMTQF